MTMEKMNKELHNVFLQSVAYDFDVCEAELILNKTIHTDFEYLKRYHAAQARIAGVENDEERLFWIGIALISAQKAKKEFNLKNTRGQNE